MKEVMILTTNAKQTKNAPEGATRCRMFAFEIKSGRISAKRAPMGIGVSYIYYEMSALNRVWG